MESIPEDLRAVTATTLSHYDMSADDYRAGTADHDVSQNVAALFRHLDGPRPWTLLDFGCGPGRDLPALSADGDVAVGLDGSAAFVRMARAATGAEVLHQNFVALDLAPARFDGIFANATLQHVPRRALADVLSRLHAALKPHGVLFASIPHGNDEEGWNGLRHSAYHAVATWRRFLADAGFVELEHFYRPAGLPPEQRRWFASAWRRA